MTDFIGSNRETRSKFMQVYSVLKSELLSDPTLQLTDYARQWMEKMLDYNVPGGKLNRGLSVIDSYRLLVQNRKLTNDEEFLACILGWCIEWVQACALVLDDVMDDAHTRRGKPCWFRLPTVGMIAIGDGLVLRHHVSSILRKHFRLKPYFMDLLDLFTEVECQTVAGQAIDLITTLTGGPDLSQYSMPRYCKIVEAKTAYYSFYLPVACALIMAGEKLEYHNDTMKILVKMGTYFQVQDDYLDCFGDHDVIGKIGTDIEDNKCTWLVAKTLELVNAKEKKILCDNYGKNDPGSVAKVKEVYKSHNLKDIYAEYEKTTFEELDKYIEACSSKAVQKVLKVFLAKINKRKK